MPLLAFLAVFSASFFSASEAHARRGIILITSGDTIAHVENIPEQNVELAMEATGHPVRVGYHYSSVGVFWLDVWTYDGEFCLYYGNSRWALEEETAQVLLGKSLSELDKPLLYRFPPFLVIVGVLLGALVIGGGIQHAVKTRRERALEDTLNGPAFQRAVEIFIEHDHNGLNPALDYLQAQGVDRQEALSNLTIVLRKRGLM